MMHGYPLVKKLCAELQDFMRAHNFSSIDEFRGYVRFTFSKFFVVDLVLESGNHLEELPFFSTYQDIT
jgi:hypothetical protein